MSDLAPRLILLVALGGVVGAVARHALGVALPRETVVWGTVAVNVLGCFVAGWLVFGPLAAPGDARLVLVSGFLGAFTTMSAFSVEAVAELADGAWGPAAATVLLNPVASLVAAAAGRWIALANA